MSTHFFQCWVVYQQSANIQFKWTLCPQVLHLIQLEGSLLWIQGSCPLRGVALQQIFNRIPLTKHQCVLFIFLWLRYNSSQWGFHYYDYAAQYYAKLTLDNDCKLLTNNVFRRISRTCNLVSSNSTTSRWCQNHYSPIPVFATSIRFLQRFISSSSRKKKLLDSLIT